MDVYHCNNDLWKTAQERESAQYQGTDESNNRNTRRIRVSAGNKDQTRPLPMLIAIDSISHWIFDLLERNMPLYQSAPGDRLEYEFAFNDYNRVIWATDDTDASYDIENISLE